MSEAQKEEFVIRIEKALSGLEKQKIWLKYAVFAFFLAAIVMIGTSFVSSYRVKENKADIDEVCEKAASKESIRLLNRNFEATTKALGLLVDDKYEEAVDNFLKETRAINDNIFLYSTNITRSAK